MSATGSPSSQPALAAFPPTAAHSAAKRPNFLFIFCDQLRGDAIGCLGAHPPLHTPALDSLVGGGVRLASAATPNPVCVPAREAVITGLWGHRYGCMENGGGRPASSIPTFPRLLHEAGYVTFAAGKQHFKPVRDARGYGRLLLSEGQPAYRQDDDYLLFLRDSGSGSETEPGGHRGPSYYLPQESPLPNEQHMTPWTAACASQFIRANRNRPFLCTAAFFKPHPPFDPPRAYWDRYPPASVGLPIGGVEGGRRDAEGLLEDADAFLRVQNRSKAMDHPDEARVRAVRSAYYALVEQLDDAIAQLLQTLRDCNLLDNTVVVVSSDHGELLGDHGAWGKRSFYEGSITVPLLLHWPAGLPAGVTRHTPVSTIDLFPTFAAIAGLPLPAPIDGLDLLATARDGVAPDRPGVPAEYGAGRARKLMWRWQERQEDQRQGGQVSQGQMGGARQWKYIWLANGRREQLFDLTADPTEQHDLAATDPGRCATARQALMAWCHATDFTAALAPTTDSLAGDDFEPLRLGQTNQQRPAWPARDPDFG